jgi:hypothetical protein
MTLPYVLVAAILLPVLLIPAARLLGRRSEAAPQEATRGTADASATES